MTPLVALFARTFLIGVAVAAPVGAMGVLCIQRTLARGWRAGIATGAGIATADGMYAAVAAFGVTALSSALVAFQSPLRIVGGLVLVWLGWRAIVAPPAHEAAAEKVAARGYGGLYASAVGLTLTNPMTIMAFAAVFASAGLGMMDGPRSALIATLGVALGSFAWWVAFTLVIVVIRHRVSDRATHWVNRVSGGAIVVLGALAAITGLMSLH